MQVDTLKQVGGGEQGGSGPTSAVTHQLSRARPRTPGKYLREKCPRDLDGSWQPPDNRPAPVHLMLAADKGRLPELFALRYGRMTRSPFTRATGDPSANCGYLGKSDVFDEVIATSTFAYSDQTEAERAALKLAIRNGEFEALIDESG